MSRSNVLSTVRAIRLRDKDPTMSISTIIVMNPMPGMCLSNILSNIGDAIPSTALKRIFKTQKVITTGTITTNPLPNVFRKTPQKVGLLSSVFMNFALSIVLKYF